MKPGFILYANQRGPIKNLSLEEKGELLDIIFEYNTTGIIGKNISNSVKIVFEFLKMQFDLDNDKYEKVCMRNKENIVKRRDKNTTGKSGIPDDTRNTNKNININKNKNINKKEKEQKEEIIYFENIKVNKLFNEFLNMRIEKKKPASITAIGLLVKKLERYLDDVKIKMLENSIIGQRTDVYELKEQKPYSVPTGMKEGYKYKYGGQQTFSQNLLPGKQL